ncbi:MAG: hypothetical protein PF488_04720 [Patescibacteria group bacterium]|jgi:hypothetical protein|nr:hypothetical protein [Patescibacteria group bacterium]
MYQETPKNLNEILTNEHYHHQDKGCNVKIRISRNKRGDRCKEVYCHTHKVLCSKTGWEYGWYSGTNNRLYEDLITTNCIICGKELESKNGNKLYCSDCKIIRIKELSLKYRKNNKKVKVKKIKKIRKEKEMKSKKLNDLIGFINEYQKTGDEYYDTRIKDFTYNGLVNRCDRIIRKKIQKDDRKLYKSKDLTKK